MENVTAIKTSDGLVFTDKDKAKEHELGILLGVRWDALISPDDSEKEIKIENDFGLQIIKNIIENSEKVINLIRKPKKRGPNKPKAPTNWAT